MLVTDFSHVYSDEGFLLRLERDGVDFRLLELGDVEGTSCYLDPVAKDEILRRVGPFTGDRLRFIDSGDYHYMTALLAGLVPGPFTLLLMDNHSDDGEAAFGDMLSCGNWAGRLGAGVNLVTFGPEGRLSVREELSRALEGTERLYISLDKDIMSSDYARTDWTQGTYTLPEIEELLLLAKEKAGGIIAVDVCGELPRSKGGKAEDFEINLTTNIELQRFITENLI